MSLMKQLRVMAFSGLFLLTASFLPCLCSAVSTAKTLESHLCCETNRSTNHTMTLAKATHETCPSCNTLQIKKTFEALPSSFEAPVVTALVMEQGASFFQHAPVRTNTLTTGPPLSFKAPLYLLTQVFRI